MALPPLSKGNMQVSKAITDLALAGTLFMGAGLMVMGDEPLAERPVRNFGLLAGYGYMLGRGLRDQRHFKAFMADPSRHTYHEHYQREAAADFNIACMAALWTVQFATEQPDIQWGKALFTGGIAAFGLYSTYESQRKFKALPPEPLKAE